MSDFWTCRHFSLANPADDRPTDLPYLLRRVADEIDRRGLDPMAILDVAVRAEIEGDGPHWSVTLYFSADVVDDS